VTEESQPTTHNAVHGAVARVGRDRRLGFLQRTQSGTCAAQWLAKYLRDILVWRNVAELLWRSHIFVGVC
jgi:hypothetical protein